MRFVDEAMITVRSGQGAATAVPACGGRPTFPRAARDGGDGGRGGDVIFRGSDRLVTLYDFRLHRHYYAKNGESGMGRDRYGKAADASTWTCPWARSSTR